MHKQINKIILIIIVLVSLPIIIFSVYEINSLNENEEIIDNIYNKQLNTVVFTMNKSIYDIFNDWAQKINLLVLNSKESNKIAFQKNVLQFIKLNPQIKSVILGDEDYPNVNNLKTFFIDSSNSEYLASLSEKINSNIPKIKRFLSNDHYGIRKIEPINLDSSYKAELFLFSLDLTNNKNDFGGIIINPEQFIKNKLAPQIIDITHNEFIITIIKENTKKIIFSSNGNPSLGSNQSLSLELLPEFSIIVSLEGKTIDQLVKERSIRNLILILVLDLIFIIGIWFVIINIKKEIELAKIKSDFVSNVSHELRTPLSLISLFAETLMLGRLKSQEKEKEYYTIIHQESGRLSRIVDKILHFQSIDEHKRKYKFKEADLNSVINKTLNIYSYHIKQSGFSYNLNLDDNIPPIYIDEEAIAEAVINLTDNAMKYSGQKKQIDIQTGMNENFVFVKIIDYGIGISIKNQNKIFDKFYRIQNGLVHNTKGAGLGLTIVKEIMEEHGGGIAVDSKEGNGSIFTLNFRKNNKSKL